MFTYRVLCNRPLSPRQWPRGTRWISWPPWLCCTCFNASHDAMGCCKGCLACRHGCVSYITVYTCRWKACITIHNLLLPMYLTHTKPGSELPCAPTVPLVLRRRSCEAWRLRLVRKLTHAHPPPSKITVARPAQFPAIFSYQSVAGCSVALPFTMAAYKRTSLGCLQACRSVVIDSGYREQGLIGHTIYTRPC